MKCSLAALQRLIQIDKSKVIKFNHNKPMFRNVPVLMLNEQKTFCENYMSIPCKIVLDLTIIIKGTAVKCLSYL